MSKSMEDAITIIEKIELINHQGQHNKNTSQRKNIIIKLNTNVVNIEPFFAGDMLLTRILTFDDDN